MDAYTQMCALCGTGTSKQCIGGCGTYYCNDECTANDHQRHVRFCDIIREHHVRGKSDNS